MVDLLPAKSYNLSLPVQCCSLLLQIKNLSFLLEDNHVAIDELYETLNVKKNTQRTEKEKWHYFRANW